MTIRAPGTPQAAAAPAAPNAEHALAVGGPDVVLGGTIAGDVIVISPRAFAIVRAGGMLVACVLEGLENLRQTITLDGNRRLRLHHGISRVV